MVLGVQTEPKQEITRLIAVKGKDDWWDFGNK